MPPNEKIKVRRRKLGLSEAEVAELVGLSWNEFFDVELHESEIFTVTELCQIRKICEILDFDFFDLFDMRCAFCEDGEPYIGDYLLPRNEFLRKRRKETGLPADVFGDRIGFYEPEVYDLENRSDHLETWAIDFIKDISDVVHAPLQILLDVRCSKCGR